MTSRLPTCRVEWVGPGVRHCSLHSPACHHLRSWGIPSCWEAGRSFVLKVPPGTLLSATQSWAAILWAHSQQQLRPHRGLFLSPATGTLAQPVLSCTGVRARAQLWPSLDIIPCPAQTALPWPSLQWRVDLTPGRPAQPPASSQGQLQAPG